MHGGLRRTNLSWGLGLAFHVRNQGRAKNVHARYAAARIARSSTIHDRTPDVCGLEDCGRRHVATFLLLLRQPAPTALPTQPDRGCHPMLSWHGHPPMSDDHLAANVFWNWATAHSTWGAIDCRLVKLISPSAARRATRAGTAGRPVWSPSSAGHLWGALGSGGSH